LIKKRTFSKFANDLVGDLIEVERQKENLPLNLKPRYKKIMPALLQEVTHPVLSIIHSCF
jgi:hypothetical protein